MSDSKPDDIIVTREDREAVALAGKGQAGMDRESKGRMVREVWIEWAREQPNPKPSWLVPWEGLAEPDREVDMRIGERLYREGRDHALEDVQAELDDMDVGDSTLGECLEEIRALAGKGE
jgi:hypothetical protein